MNHSTDKRFSRERIATSRGVVVVGGGIGGLAAALALAQKNFPVLVLERSGAFAEIGAGIQLAPNAWHAIDALGVGHLVKREAVFIERLQMMDGLSGEKIVDLSLGPKFQERYGNPYAVTHRADIHAALLNGCLQSKNVELRTNSRVEQVELSDGQPTLRLSDGETLRAAAVVGADGIRSVVRRYVVGDGDAKPSGHLCYRAVLPAEEVPGHLRWAAATLWAGPNTHIVHYPLRGWKLFNLVATVVDDNLVDLHHNQEVSPEEVLTLFERNCDAPMQLLRRPRSFRRWMLRFRQPVENWSIGAITLLGDAAHPMLQYLAQGAAMALEDAISLASACASSGGDFESAFKAYQEERIIRASRVQLSAGLMGLVFHQDGIARRVRNEIYRTRDQESIYRSLDWLYHAPAYVKGFRGVEVPSPLQ